MQSQLTPVIFQLKNKNKFYIIIEEKENIIVLLEVEVTAINNTTNEHYYIPTTNKVVISIEEFQEYYEEVKINEKNFFVSQLSKITFDFNN